MRKIFSVFLALGIVSSSHAFSNSPLDAVVDMMVGTLNVTNSPMMTNGELTGCTLTYDVIYKDFTYRKGRPIKVIGSFGFLSANDTIGSTLKVVVNEMSSSEDGRLILSPSAPQKAYLIGRNYEHNHTDLVLANPSDLDGGLFSIFRTDKSFDIIINGIEDGKIVIAFNQNNGGTDIQMPVDLTVLSTDMTGKRTFGNDAIHEFMKCMQILYKTK